MDSNKNNPFERRENKREVALKEMKDILESLGVSESIIKSILESLRKFSDNDLDRFVSGGTLFLKTRLQEILESINMEKGPEGLLERVERIMRKYMTKEDEDKEEEKKEIRQNEDGSLSLEKIEGPDMEGLDNRISKQMNNSNKSSNAGTSDKSDDDTGDEKDTEENV